MGTNYYIGLKHAEFHIGKASAGWKFLFQAQTIETSIYDPSNKVKFGFCLELRSFKEVVTAIKELLKVGFKLYDEYCREYSLEEFIKIVKEKQSGKSHLEITNKYNYLYYQDDEGYEFTESEFC